MADDVKEANKSSDPMGSLMERRKYKGQSFASAFREARGAGDKTFFWNGKRYTTELASASKPAARPQMSASASAGRGGPTAEEMREQRLKDTFAGRSAGRGGPTAEEMREQRLKDTFAGRSAGLGGVTPGESSETEYKRGGKVKGYAKGGVTRGDGCVTKGHTKGKMR